MKPWKVIATDGKWTLRNRGDEYLVQVEGKILMSSRRHGSEEELARIGCARIASDNPTVLVGGLGFGFTLRAALDVLPSRAKVLVSELSPAVVEWNRGAIAPLAGAPLEDPRVEVIVGDVQRVLPKHRGKLDVLLLDIDNGPFAVSAIANANMYDLGGLSSTRASLKKGGRLAVWSAGQQGGFTKRMKEVGFEARVEKTGDGKHLIFVGDV